MSRILAIDQSSKVSGYSIFIDDELEDYGKMSYTDDNPIKRILKLRRAVDTLISENDIEKVILEDIQMQGNTNNVVTYKILAFTLGALQLLCEELGIEYEVISSSTWKSRCGVKGKGRTEQKQAAQKFVLEEFNVKAIQDICDAICIGYAAIHTKPTGINFK